MNSSLITIVTNFPTYSSGKNLCYTLAHEHQIFVNNTAINFATSESGKCEIMVQKKRKYNIAHVLLYNA